ncbi:hypothetical protein SAMN05519103_08602 [Rhizobiales bacterium GAS113]|nr:hypothetical protein SAMN05519103_08602 [Rhizobiales bacterium GAS113]
MRNIVAAAELDYAWAVAPAAGCPRLGGLFFGLCLGFVACPALAQVPVKDTQREGKETSIARCVAKSQQLKQEEMSPRQGVTKSVRAPGSGGGASAVGNVPVLGSSVSQASPPASVAGVNLEGITSAPQIAGVPTNVIATTASLLGNGRVATAAQVVGALGAMAGALSSNASGLNGVGAQIGAVNGIQGAWDQNSSGRLAGAAVWGQGIQAGTLTLQMLNERMLRKLAEQSESAKLMQYEASRARLVDDDQQGGR